jgi:hypothetical protein
MGERLGRGSLTGTWRQRADNLPAMRGAITIERDVTLKAGSHLHIAGWVRSTAGAEWLSLIIEPATKGRRR